MKQMISVWKPNKKGGMKLRWKKKKIKEMTWMKDMQSQKDIGELKSQQKSQKSKTKQKGIGKNEGNYLKNNSSDLTSSDSAKKLP